jgi:acyl-coenzyme A synthetase/AMP-(fatty) acid ligase
MLVEALMDFAEVEPTTPVLVSGARTWSPIEFLALSKQWAFSLEKSQNKNVAFHLKVSPDLLAALVAASYLGMTVTVLKKCSSLSELHDLQKRFRYDLFVTDADKDLALPVDALYASEVADASIAPDVEWRHIRKAAGGGFINILTSGTTGKPKNVRYSWSELIAQIPVNLQAKRETQRWLLAYHLSHYAGVQVFLHALLHHNALVIASSQTALSMWSAAIEGDVSHISSTPTFWRTVLAAHGTPNALRALKHVTLSGEIVTQDVLNRLALLYPDISISQVYASTELGSLVSVRDRRPGLPSALFKEENATPSRFKIVDSELYVHTPSSGAEWLATGDLVEMHDDRVLFVGRKSEVINVGGVKVNPQLVEALVSPLDGVLFVRAVGQPNPITGQIVRLDVVLKAGHERASVDAKIRSACSELGNHARPRQIYYLDSMETNNMKLTRRAL